MILACWGPVGRGGDGGVSAITITAVSTLQTSARILNFSQEMYNIHTYYWKLCHTLDSFTIILTVVETVPKGCCCCCCGGGGVGALAVDAMSDLSLLCCYCCEPDPSVTVRPMFCWSLHFSAVSQHNDIWNNDIQQLETRINNCWCSGGRINMIWIRNKE